MYEDLEQIANLKFVKERDSISQQTREKITQMQNDYAARAGSSGIRSGQHEASIGRVQIEGAERSARVFLETWLDLIQRRKGHISRADLSFIANKVASYAETQKIHLHTAFSAQRMGAVVNVLTEEANMRMHAVAANARRDLEIIVREHEAFPIRPNESTKRSDAEKPAKEGNPTRRTAQILNILIASPSDVRDEREIVERTIHDWNATHFPQLGIMLNPIRWETHAYPASGNRPQAIINKQIVESGDILIGIFGYKLGTPTGAAQSGTIEEIEEFRRAGKYVALYFSTADVPRSADRTQLEALESFKKERQKDTLYFEFSNPFSLRDHLTNHLPKIVHVVSGNLGLPAPGEGLSVESSGTANSAKSHLGPATAQGPHLLADVISELEDNLDCAQRPRTGNVYRRPSTSVWVQNRNKITLPADISLKLKDTYSRIGSWRDIATSGLNPNLGSMQLDLIVSELRSSLPSLIDQLRKVSNPSSESEDAIGQRPPAPASTTLAKGRRALEFLPDLSPKEIELLVLAARDRSGQIFHRQAIGREQLSVGDHILLDSNNPRSRAEWIGAVDNLVLLGLLEAVGQKGEFYRLTDSGYRAADLLDDFARWPTNQVNLEARYLNAPSESLPIACSAVTQLPAVYYQYRIRPNGDPERTEKEPRSLLIEGADLKSLNEISWQLTHISFVVNETNEPKSFPVARTPDRRVAKFHVNGRE